MVVNTEPIPDARLRGQLAKLDAGVRGEDPQDLAPDVPGRAGDRNGNRHAHNYTDGRMRSQWVRAGEPRDPPICARPSHQGGWPDDHYSMCTFLLEPVGNKTKLSFIQTGVPEDSAAELKKGWKQYYWEAIKTYLFTT